ncbi:MAG: glycoside hydrolase family 32 protein, partial [Lachnospiraceae bacterium]|nr:glycoside hydrolase family 32 protein [Lachnospiraceae bacterium]
MEKSEDKNITDPYRLNFHLMPPQGWLNDPNGLCCFKGEYHIFFQYAPDSPTGGGKKVWGHYAGKSLIDLDFKGISLYADNEADRNGVYSGSALIDEGVMKLYYTGNVKQAGDHDYTYSGREANTVMVSSDDGIHFSEKNLLMTNSDYPAEYTCHVRDPKVWKSDGRTFMVQGGRLDGRGTEAGDKGAVIVFERAPMPEDGKANKSSAAEESGSDTLAEKWTVLCNISTHDPFGYMWECPDYFAIKGKKFLSCSPQGLASEEYRYQNVYQSGYFSLSDGTDIMNANGHGDSYIYIDSPQECFTEWDMGFDFYAPQSFTDDKGRMILIGWAGIPDADYDNEPTVKEGWQHALTVPRVISVSEKNGKLLQYPVEEIETLRQDMRSAAENSDTPLPLRSADILAEGLSAEDLLDGRDKAEILQVKNAGSELFGLSISGNDNAGENVYILTLSLSSDAGRGRTERKVLLDRL